MASQEYLFFHRQSARNVGILFMIGPLVIASLAVADAAFGGEGYGAWIAAGCFVLMACLSFVYGLRRVIYGGAWGCFIDHEFMTWTYPNRMQREDCQFALRDITKLVEEFQDDGDGRSRSYYIETAGGRAEIHIDCFRHVAKLRRALREANPTVEFEIKINGEVKLPVRPI